MVANLNHTGKIKSLWKKFFDKDYRYAYLETHLRETIASQLYSIRESQKLTQSDLANLVGTKQPAISRIEKGEASLSVKSLEAIARAFDVALSIKFVPFSEVAEDVVYGRIEAYVPPFSDDEPLTMGSVEDCSPATTAYIRLRGGDSRFSWPTNATATRSSELQVRAN